MTVMTNQEFKQNVSQAQKTAQTEPVIITNRGEPAYVLMTYTEYEKTLQSKSVRSGLDALMSLDAADIELELQPRSRAQRRPVDFEDQPAELNGSPTPYETQTVMWAGRR
jgi:prevent-host-death family protein